MLWVFVLALVTKPTHEIRFEHTFVRASDEADAYLLGQRYAENEGWIPVADGESANDYVVPIAEANG